MVIDAIAELGPDEFFTLTHKGDKVEALSSNTHFDSIEVSPETIFETDQGKFFASATVYVQLNYSEPDGDIVSPEQFPAVVEGEFVGNVPLVTGVKVDTSSFYE